MTFEWPIAVPELSDGDLTLVPSSEAIKIPNMLKDLTETCRDPRMLEFTNVPLDYTEEMAAAFVDDPAAVRWALLHNDRYSGNIELRLDNLAFAHVNVGYSTSPWARGKGLQSRALRLVRDHAFSEGVFRFTVKAAVHNSASRHVAESNGFQFEGIQRGGEIVHGKVMDLAVYAALSTDDLN